jgi:hypothetical protein
MWSEVRSAASSICAALAVAAGGGMRAVIAASGLRARENVLHLVDP